jgi:hypothetical protein
VESGVKMAYLDDSMVGASMIGGYDWENSMKLSSEIELA